MNILLSYPRSGNSFFRYNIEVLSGKITQGRTGDYDIVGDKGWLIKDDTDILLKKGHVWEDITHYLNDESKLIVLVRDYKECFISSAKRAGKKNKNDILNFVKRNIKRYYKILEDYDSFNNDKILIYYEDFLEDISETMFKSLDFLTEKVNENIQKDFENDLNIHVNKSKELYINTTKINNNASGILSENEKHQNIFNKSEIRKLDNMMKDYDERLFDKYLKRYEKDE